jgi:hypothetical protein
MMLVMGLLCGGKGLSAGGCCVGSACVRKDGCCVLLGRLRCFALLGAVCSQLRALKVSLLTVSVGMKKNKSWFNFGRQQGAGGSSSSTAAGSAGASSSAADGTAGASSTSSAAAARSERVPMLQLFTGRSDGDGEARGGLLSSLMKNK